MKEEMKYTATTVWILFILALLVGAIIGYLIGVNMAQPTITGKSVSDEDYKEEIASFKNECLNQGVEEAICDKLIVRFMSTLNN